MARFLSSARRLHARIENHWVGDLIGVLSLFGILFLSLIIPEVFL
jgi:hypothetical protein